MAKHQFTNNHALISFRLHMLRWTAQRDKTMSCVNRKELRATQHSTITTMGSSARNTMGKEG